MPDNEIQDIPNLAVEAKESLSPLCFRTPELATIDRIARKEHGQEAPKHAYSGLVGLSDPGAEGLGHLVPHLLCGEESAVLVFFHRSRSKADLIAREGMLRIAREEKVHEIMLAKVQTELPTPADITTIQERAHAFFVSMTMNDPATHFAAIAALDSGVCKIMSALCSSPVVKACPVVHQIFSQILQEESGHVRFSRRCASDLGLSHVQMNDIGEPVRVNLPKFLETGASAFEKLAVDPDRLFRRIRREL
jgi:hypothetical protein